MPFKEISLQPELSSPPHFRIQGGSPERDGAGAGAGGVVARLYLSFLIFNELYTCILQFTLFYRMSVWPNLSTFLGKTCSPQIILVLSL